MIQILSGIFDFGHPVLLSKELFRFEPLYSLKRGRILRQLHLPVLTLAKLDLKAKKISLPEFVLKTKQALKNMAEVTKCMENFDEVNHINGKNGKDFQALERDQAQSALGYLS